MNRQVSQRKFNHQLDRIEAYIAKARPGFNWRLVAGRYPRIVLEMRRTDKNPPYVLEVYANQWDARPPAYRFVVPGQPRRILPRKNWPPDHPFQHLHQPVGQNRVSNRPFICLRGTRDYHNDRRHQDGRWEANCRGKAEFSILAMLITIQLKINTAHGWTPNDRSQPYPVRPSQPHRSVQAGPR